jgi:hypothetical protein
MDCRPVLRRAVPALAFLFCIIANAGPATHLMSRSIDRVITIEHVVIPAEVTVDGVDLMLNGLGVHKHYFVFKRYIVALYLEQPTDSLPTVIGQHARSRLWIHALVDLARADIVEPLDEAIHTSTPRDQLLPLEPEIQQIEGLLAGLSAGDELVFDYAPGVGTTVRVNGEKLGSVGDRALHQTLMRAWLGRSPVDPSLRKTLLGI